MATLITDDFNSYNDGDVIGQGNWVDHIGGTGIFNVQGTVVKEGAKAIKATITSLGGQKVIRNLLGAGVPTGTQVFYLRLSSVTLDHQAFVSVRGDGGNMLFNVGVNGSIAAGGVAGVDEIFISNSGGGTTTDTLVIKTGIVADTWYEVEFQWQTSDDTCRARVDGGTWSNWIPYESNLTESPIGIRLIVNDLGALSNQDAYFDTFQETAFVAASGMGGSLFLMF